jgi:hypothetical protein
MPKAVSGQLPLRSIKRIDLEAIRKPRASFPGCEASVSGKLGIGWNRAVYSRSVF